MRESVPGLDSEDWRWYSYTKPPTYGPWKSFATPFESAIPRCPITGMNQVMIGNGDHKMQKDRSSFFVATPIVVGEDFFLFFWLFGLVFLDFRCAWNHNIAFDRDKWTADVSAKLPGVVMVGPGSGPNQKTVPATPPYTRTDDQVDIARQMMTVKQDWNTFTVTTVAKEYTTSRPGLFPSKVIRSN